MEKGKVIVFEGTDASGKETQANALYNKLKEAGIMVKKISFPNYDSPASEPVKMYLRGDFGEKSTEVNPFAISAMYAIDRFASFQTEWKSFYETGGIIITDRYTTSNIVHQASKIEGLDKRRAFVNWLEDLEYNKIGLPRPDLVIFLKMPPEQAQKLMASRNNKITGQAKKDIHEADSEYLEKSYNNAVEISDLLEWSVVPCTKGDTLKKISEIQVEVYDKASEIL